MKKIHPILLIIVTATILWSCNTEELPTYDNVNLTVIVNNVNGNSADLTCNLTNPESLNVDEHGFCWNEFDNPTTNDYKTESGTLSSKSFNENIQDLEPAKDYFFKAYIIINGITLYSQQIKITTTSGLAKLTTNDFTDITISTATCGGNITDDDGFKITVRGVCWSTTPNPTISNNKTADGVGIGSFTSSLTGLTEWTTYYVRAYATNENGTSYGNEISFVARKTIKDYDGNIYGIITIGNQTWMTENLKVTHFADGTEITLIDNFNDWKNLSVDDKAYCVNSETYIYGALYNLPAAMNGSESSNSNPSNVQGVCPDGWHLPSDDEWKELEIYLGMNYSEADLFDWRGADEGAKLKSISGWYNNGNGNNLSGFTAFPGGNCTMGGLFANAGTDAFFWSSTAGDNALTPNNLIRGLSFYNMDIYRNSRHWLYGFSVRCVED